MAGAVCFASAYGLTPYAYGESHHASAAHQVSVDIFPLQQVIQRSLSIQLDACFTGLPLTPPIAPVAAQCIAASELQHL